MQHDTAMISVAFALAAALSACGGPKQEEQPAAFGQCLTCHSVEPGRNMTGPSLAGVFGRKAGSLPDFTYSKALKDSGLSWDAATLDKWLSGPMNLVPGTRMTFAGYADPARRKEVIDYLQTLK